MLARLIACFFNNAIGLEIYKSKLNGSIFFIDMVAKRLKKKCVEELYVISCGSYEDTKSLAIRV